ncbi:lipoyl(octanoyl) transferase LipB [Microbacterium karelineae]|uniref:lipoyl(octanoyl) transferase LipB n=1 Tax=Microbacterium karelineae TaxID=2654283 RepID=UPI0012EA3EB5|nr:lipoyl(octanoyl) transferase LipB [Microbacterium karelineae]
MIEVFEAGFAPRFVTYRDGWDLQRRIHEGVVAGTRAETLILLEHEAVFTAGSRTEDHERPGLSATPVIDVDRGGKITWHGPGQLVGYPIIRIGAQREVVGHVRRLERMLIDLLAPFGIEGILVKGRTGVWVETDGAPNKIGAIGVRVEKGVAMHGFALNCSNSLAPYEEIIPCGITDAGVTTITRETGREVSPADIAAAVPGAFREVFEGVAA